MTDHPQLDPDRWVDEYGDYLYRYALTRLHDDATAQDVVQETFLAAVKGAKRFSGRSSEKTWLVGILKHKIVDYVRKASRERSYEDVSQAEGVVDDFLDRKGAWKVGQADWRINPRKAFEQAEFWAVFEDCMNGLQDRLHSVFALRELEGQSAEEICQELNISSSNLWVMLYRARGKLKTCLEQNWFKANQAPEYGKK
jgi:RNA polymerase sigma-70 factor (ECF subfamily)